MDNSSTINENIAKLTAEQIATCNELIRKHKSKVYAKEIDGDITINLRVAKLVALAAGLKDPFVVRLDGGTFSINYEIYDPYGVGPTKEVKQLYSFCLWLNSPKYKESRGITD